MNQPSATIRYSLASQTLTFDAPEGRPSSVTSVQVFEDTQSDDSTAESAITGSASVETGSTTLTATAGPGASRSDLLRCTAVSSFSVGRRYIVTSAYGWREWFDCVGKDSTSLYLYTRTGLQNDYASADTVETARMTATLSTTWVSDTGNLSDMAPWPKWRAVWTYVVSGVTYRQASFFDLVRYPLTHSVTIQDVDRLSRGLLSRLPVEDMGDGQALLDEALQQVKLDLQENGHTAYAFRGSEVFSELVRRRAVMLVHEQARLHGGAVELLELARQLYNERLDNLLGAAPKVWPQVTDDGAAGPATAAAAWRR